MADLADASGYPGHTGIVWVKYRNGHRNAFGGSAPDYIIGNAVDNIIRGNAGDDTLEGGGGNDTLSGGGGGDHLDGGSGRDQLYGDAGNDIIDGGDGSDTVYYALARDQYDITLVSDHYVIKPKIGQPQSEGTDQLYRIENFDFKDSILSAERLFQVTSPTPNNPPPPPTTYGDTPGGGTFATQNQDIADTTGSQAFVVPGSQSNSGIPFISAIEAANDKDYVRVYLNQGSTYQIYLEGFANGGYSALTDTFFRVRDGRDLSISQPLAQAPTHLNNHDQIVGNNARIDFVAPYTGLYFISIGAGGTNFENLTGGYRLSVTLLGTPPGEPTNHNPIAANFILDAQYGQVIGGNFLVAGSDPDGDIRGTDIINSLQTSRGGIIDVLANGAFQYHAPANGTDNATDTFTYTVRDGRGGSAIGNVSIQLHEPVPAMPTFTNGSDVVHIPVGGGPYYALDGNDVLIGSPGENRVVFGGEGNDTFIAGGLGSHLLGGPGDDWFVASTTGGDNFINDGFGSPLGGNDTADFSNLTVNLNASLLSGTATAGSIGYGVTVSNIIGGSGNDRIIGYETDNLLSGGPGNDFLQGNGGNDNLYGGAGDDDLQSGDGDDNVFGGDGNDTIFGDFNTAGRDFLDGGAGDDVVEGGGGDDVLDGGDGDDGVFGEDGDDYIFASAGTDRLRGLEGIDTVDFSHAPVGITGGSGQITIAGWGVSTLEELEILIASPNNDDFSLSPPFQEVHLGAGNDRLSANGQAEVFGDDGNDLIFAQNVGKVFGGSGNDDLRSFGGNAEFHGDDGDDKLFGGGTNVLYGGAGDDQLFGGGSSGNTLYGDAGADQLSGSSGNDILDGGLGMDTAVFSGPRSAYTLTRINGLTLQVSGPDGTDTLTHVERLAFDGGTIPSGLGVPQTDLDGDSHGDVLWQHTSGQPGVWLMNGITATQATTVGSNPGPSWNVIGSGDFDGNGKSDILWQNSNGQPGVWLMDGSPRRPRQRSAAIPVRRGKSPVPPISMATANRTFSGRMSTGRPGFG